MDTRVDVVVIGGGIAGASTLFHLAQSGISNALLLEMNRLGSGTTSRTAGWVRRQRLTELDLRISERSFDEFHSFDRAFDVGLDIRGSISIGLLDAVERDRARARFQSSHGVQVQVLTADEIHSLAPLVEIANIGVGLYCREDGLVDAQALTNAYVKQARARGAQVVEGVQATGITTDHGRVTGVATTQGLISTPVVVNAAGLYAKRVGAWVGLDLPLRNELGQIITTEPLSAIPGDMPLLEILDAPALYIGSHGKAAEYSVGTFEPTEDYEPLADLAHFSECYLDLLQRHTPVLAAARIANCMAGIRTSTLDGAPLLGPVEGLAGFVNNCGWGGQGIIGAPVGGELVAQSVLGIRQCPIDSEPFLLRRFGCCQISAPAER